ncbi:hypothetical protein OPQ81_004908 [Rhizoctonia solani]|nr:hypothetical protein OPQ81_004908 [Rhizoctonia solani]
MSPTESVPALPDLQPNPELIKTYYTAFKGLLNGSSSRQALPQELVLYICRLAEFERWYKKRAPQGRTEVHASDSQMLSHTKGVQLMTISRHQGWVNDRNAGSWSWFELQVARPTEQDASRTEIKRRPDGNEMSWCCLVHPVDPRTARLQGNFAEHMGDVVDSDHEIWKHVEEGDVLQVVMKARFGGWSNTACDGVLMISTWWEPSAKMLDLMEESNVNTYSK